MLGQFHAIGHACFKGGWVNPILSALYLYRGAGPIFYNKKPHFGVTMGHRQHIIRQVLGQFLTLAMPVSRRAGPIPCYRHGLFKEGLGQLQAIGSTTLERLWAIRSMSFGRCWANPMLSALSL